jgi:microsomal dipeptidase-like Zn-dependent dipeptidase
MTHSEYLIRLASNPTEENLQRLKEAVEEFQKRLERATQDRKSRPILQVEEPTPESEYQEELQHVQRMYERASQKDVTTMPPVALEFYRQEMDRIRYARVSLESDRSIEEKLAELKVQRDRHSAA